MNWTLTHKGLVISALMAVIAGGLTASASGNEREYSVWVNGHPVEVLAIPAPSHHDWQLPDEAAQPYWASLFDAEGEITVRVESDSDISAARVLPLSCGVVPRHDKAHALEFTATPPFTLSVEPRPRPGARRLRHRQRMCRPSHPN